MNAKRLVEEMRAGVRSRSRLLRAPLTRRPGADSSSSESTGTVLHAISLGAVLFGLWLLLSGFFEPLLLIFGLLSCLFVVKIALRMDVVDHEGHPIHLRFGGLARYWAWLTLEVIKSNLDVARRILDPALPISPTVTRVKSSQRTELGQVIFANSITLTPGTVSINLNDQGIAVHALTRAGAEELHAGEMDRRVSFLEELP